MGSSLRPPMQRASDQARLLHDRLVAAAKSLQPLLAEQAEATERERRITDASIDALQDAGLFRMLTPRCFGGHEVGARTWLDVIALTAEACGSTAWVLSLITHAAWFAGMLGDQARTEIFGNDPDTRIAGVFAPSEDMRREDDGVRVSGKWFWASGSLHANWAMLGVLERDVHGREVDHWLGFVPMRELSLENTWYASGMKGTGSNCLVAEDLFIPSHRLLSLRQAIAGTIPNMHPDETLYRSACVPMMVLALLGPQLGLARAALQHTIAVASRRNIPYTIYRRESDSPAFQMQIAEAALQIDSAHLHAWRIADDIDAFANRGQRMDLTTRARARASAGYVGKLVTESINTLISAYGAGAFADANPLQRIWRDANTAARHALVLPPVCEEIYGKALLGLDNNITPLI
jgi:3-hydroxy-9,10-secoandrosta-1,3,5(10)-triene-9,17-dione monooxygenase